MPLLENRLLHARSYLEGTILDRNLPHPLRGLCDCARLPECWGTIHLPREVKVDNDRVEISQSFRARRGEVVEVEESYVAECSVDPLYPLYYYEVRVSIDLETLQRLVRPRLCNMIITIGFVISPPGFLSGSSTSTSSAAIEDSQPRTADTLTTSGVGSLMHHGYGKKFLIVLDRLILLAADATYAIASGELIIAKYPVFSADSVRYEGRVTLGCAVSRIDGHIFYTRDGVILDDSRQYFSELKGKALCPVVRVQQKSSETTHLRITANFGQYRFTYDISSWTGAHSTTWRRKFLEDARSLPREIIIIIAAFAADAARE
ncbi:uncharacterized protein PHACADRAFT_184922 [Phanerochaete carnosa HHB-10118-sp]|uniref:Uncharacterized protein n=1 Tax=Phanerochaete carnosa (strain HHB-10118-sp) TaxID=650164 RepID=K5UV74_PHACS|nr:uncharacterized protein PHACADRAFT_184922 [Phanerochaete carnosa HHB-10118-sp]EKM53891.1 hypothetical protein PHACADRAFT_184922 [Phanerochaete carnosa HHB-10118-sp]